MAAFYPLILGLLGVLMGSTLDVMVKAIASDISVIAITSWRFVFGALLTGTAYAIFRRKWPTREQALFHAGRGAIQLTAAFSFFFGITQLALAEATVLGMTAALMVPWIARLMIGEAVSKITVLAGIVGFLGAAFAMTGETAGAPAEGRRWLGIFSVVVAAVTYATAVVMLRMRSSKEDSFTLIMFGNLAPAILVAPIAGWCFIAAPPSYGIELSQLPVIALVAMVAVSTWWLLTLAYSRAPAQRIALLDYTAVIWSSLFGAVLFREMPSWQLWVGAVIIVIACILVAFDTHFETRRLAKISPSDLVN